MSKNSFAENFNNCVSGFPIASVAAHVVLHEGLLKDIGKVGALAGLGYLGYNYGDKLGDWANQAGDAMGLNSTDGENAGTNAVGRALTGAHNWAKEGLQDSIVGKAAGLGGPGAQQRRDYEAYFASGSDAIKRDHDNLNAQAEAAYQRGEITAAQRDQFKSDAEVKAHNAYSALRGKADEHAANLAAQNKDPNAQKYVYQSQDTANPYHPNQAQTPPQNPQPAPKQPAPVPTHPQQQHPGLSDGSGGTAAYNQKIAANPGEGSVPQTGGLKPNTTGPTYQTPKARAEKANQPAAPAAPASTSGPLKPNTTGPTYQIPQARMDAKASNTGMPAKPTQEPAAANSKPQAMKINPQRVESLNQGQK